MDYDAEWSKRFQGDQVASGLLDMSLVCCFTINTTTWSPDVNFVRFWWDEINIRAHACSPRLCETFRAV